MNVPKDTDKLKFFFKKLQARVKKRLRKDPKPPEDFFWDFLSILNPEIKKEKLEQELLGLKKKLLKLEKREQKRQCISLIAVIPFALLMVIQLETIYGGYILQSTIGIVLGHALLPSTALSLACAIYLIYNNIKIAQKEREIKDKEEELKDMKSEGGVKKDKHSNFDLGFCLACVKAIAPLLIISSELIGEISPFGIVEDTLFLIANFISCAVAIHDCVKEGKGEKNDIYLLATGLTLVGSSVLLTRKVLTMLEVTELASLNPVVFPALGLLGVALLISGCALIVYSRSKELKKQSCRLTDLETSQANGHTHTEVEPIC